MLNGAHNRDRAASKRRWSRVEEPASVTEQKPRHPRDARRGADEYRPCLYLRAAGAFAKRAIRRTAIAMSTRVRPSESYPPRKISYPRFWAGGRLGRDSELGLGRAALLLDRNEPGEELQGALGVRHLSATCNELVDTLTRESE